jgi:propanediol utilization protein
MGLLQSPAGREAGGIPAEASARHVHLTRSALEALFGPGASLSELRALSQPGEFLSDKRVTLKGPKGSLENAAVLGPLRKAVQVEMSLTDSRVLGIHPPLRISGDLSGAADLEIAGPSGSLKGAAIIAASHLHLRPSDAEKYGLKDGDFVRVRVNTRRPLVFEKTAVRVRDDFMPALHLDFDEANACMLAPGDSAEILDCPWAGAPPGPKPSKLSKPALITEADAKRLVLKNGEKIILPKGTILTPSAKDVFLHSRRVLEYR